MWPGGQPQAQLLAGALRGCLCCQALFPRNSGDCSSRQSLAQIFQPRRCSPFVLMSSRRRSLDLKRGSGSTGRVESHGSLPLSPPLLVLFWPSQGKSLLGSLSLQ